MWKAWQGGGTDTLMERRQGERDPGIERTNSGMLGTDGGCWDAEEMDRREEE